jgi:hypothetical protein
MAIDIPTVDVTMQKGDSIWNLLRSNQTGLNYSESELDRSPELFVYILWFNAIVNFRNVVPPVTLHLPQRDSLADVVVRVRSDSQTFSQKYFEWVEMDRCAGT